MEPYFWGLKSLFDNFHYMTLNIVKMLANAATELKRKLKNFDFSICHGHFKLLLHGVLTN